LNAMPRIGSSSFAFPDFRGATRRLILVNLAAYFLLLIASATSSWGDWLQFKAAFSPILFLHGWLWQPLTYSLIHPTLFGALLELLSLWFLAGFLESYHDANWVMSLYAVSVLGAALTALAVYLCAVTLAPWLLGGGGALYGCFGGIFGLLAAIGLLYGDVRFTLFPLPISIKARHLVVIYVLIAIAYLFFHDERMYAFAELGGGLAGLLFVRMAPRRGFSFMLSESWYGMRNRYYRWKRRKAARKFEVYMKRQGKTVKLDGQGRILNDDPDDKKRWN
jgi:membrane associated rhomboid family serine protease